MNSTRFFPYFKDCVGAIDYSHIPVMITGWEGSASDSRILADALNRQHKLIVPTGKYYLVDADFANAPGFLAPFRGVRYHLKEFRQGCQPRIKEELFNLRHSSLRNAIERAFGVLKARFSILKIASGYPLNTQVNIVAACCILHNHIINEKHDQELDFENYNDIGNGEDESEMHEDEGNKSSEDENECDFRNESAAARREKQRWREFRLGLASAMWESYKSEQNIN
ncbi:uncharacterized protein LOC131228855 [Magnolia sinica]|uniref:uncharacterized protein LOC131228855 n=1 Tax=Magnolia sinica TaxID=86752 RepID=UPI002659F4E4|nr:uncharacterized protein LOC131228855 [Magnolia sinica]